MEKGAIALLDVLGWKGIWLRRGTAALAELDELVHSAKQHALDFTSGTRGGDTFRSRYGTLVPDVLSISDTIALTVRGELNMAIEFASILSISILTRAIDRGFLFRGAISYGDFLSKGNMFIGPAVDEVASSYEQADWIGVHLTPSAELRVDTSTFLDKTIVVQHPLPLKEGKRDGLACGWPFYYQYDLKTPEDRKKALIDALLQIGPQDKDIGVKTMNTITFYGAHCRK